MPHKKKEPKDTCDVGTDPLEPPGYDPLDLNGHAIIDEFDTITETVQEALTELRKQNTTGTPKTIKDSVIHTLERALRWMEDFTNTLDRSRTVQSWQLTYLTPVWAYQK
jgi:hypothetical protein